jgi:signal transduction histidine kinase
MLPEERDRLLAETSILFVDDDPLVRSLARGLLEGRLKALHLAPGGQEGLFAFALHAPDLVVTDVTMPGMDGLELTRAVRGIKPDTPVLLVTAFEDPELFRKSIALGISDYLTKPLERGPLLASLGRAARTLHLRRELDRQLALNQLMLNAAPSPTALVELESGRVLAANQLAASLGYRQGEICAEAEVAAVLAELRQGGEQLMGAGSSREIADGRRNWVLHWAPAGRDAILFTAVDITQRVRFEHFREDVERITRHDLKTPLSAFTALPDLLLEDANLTERQREFIRLMRDAGTRMLAMINLSLDLYKMETGAYSLPPERLDFAAVARQALSAALPLAQSLDVGLELDDASGGPLPMRGDDLLCLSLIDNLLKNALEASQRGERVQLRLSRGTGAELAIRNHGEVPRDVRERFFEKYATSGKTSGTGLGTYSARMAARAHGGEVVLDASEPGCTTVRVLLPLAADG